MGIVRSNQKSILASNGAANGRQPKPFEEVGTPGLDMYSGWIMKAYNTQLFWPSVEPLYSRIWRSDPEVTVVRTLFDAWASGLDVTIELPENVGGQEVPAMDDDKKAQEFGYSVLDDIEGGIGKWVTSVTARAPFYGWGFWETPLGLRRPNWKPPNEGDQWRSEYDDGLVGIRRLAFRDYSSFERWEADDYSGRVTGLWQGDQPNPRRLIPFSQGLHITYGDSDNPEGLATLEALWRLERIKYGLEVVMGIGFEHAAGYLDVTAEKKLTTEDKAHIAEAARAVMSAQEGNYAAWPEGFKGELRDVPFSAAPSILDTIRYYSILKLSLLGMQWVALSSMTGAGSFASMKDSSGMAVLLFNSMVGSFEQQFNDQLMKRLYTHPVNAAAFPNMTRRPQLRISRLDKSIELEQLGAFATAMNAIMPLGDDDYIAIRRKSELLPETLPKPEEAGSAVSTGTPGATVEGVTKIIESVRSGAMPTAVAIETLVFIGVSRDVAEKMIAEIEQAPLPEADETAAPQPEPESPEDDMTPEDETAVEEVEDAEADMSMNETAELAQSPEEAYEEKIALMIMRAQDGRLPRVKFEQDMVALVLENAEMMFKRGAGIEQDDSLLRQEQSAFEKELAIHIQSIKGLADEIYNEQ